MDDNHKWVGATLRIFSGEIRLREIESILNIRATRAHDKGEAKSSSHGGVWRESFWSLQSQLTNDRSVSEHLTGLLNALEPSIDTIRLLSEKCRIDLFCGFSSGSGQGGFTLDVALLNRICKFGVPLVLDLYPPGVEDEGSEQE